LQRQEDHDKLRIGENGIGLYIHTQALDTSTPAGRAMFQMLGSEFERE
jgi:DNA invertase Pin-like site-specific DNA recombinase